MTRLLICIALLFGAFAPGLGAAEVSPLDQSAAYFTELRMAYSKRPDFNPYVFESDKRKEMFEAFKARDLASVISRSAPWLDTHPVDAEVHYLRSIALGGTGDLQGAVRHTAFYYGLINSLLASGDGQSEETAIQVITVAEEYWLVQELSGNLISQNLESGGNAPYDVLEIESGGKRRKLWFDVSIPLTATGRILNQQ